MFTKLRLLADCKIRVEWELKVWRVNLEFSNEWNAKNKKNKKRCCKIIFMTIKALFA